MKYLFCVTASSVGSRAHFGWLNHYRHLTKRYERLIQTDKTWGYIAMSRIMLNRLG